MALYNTKADVSNLGNIDPEVSKYLANEGSKNPMLLIPLPTLLQMSRQNALPLQAPPGNALVITIPMRDGHQNGAVVYKPTTVSRSRPLIVLIHGGGFCLGDNSLMRPHAEALSILYGAVVVCISYRLAPEFKFPTAPNDVWDNLKWLTIQENAQSLGADLSAGFIVGGTSAGASLAAVTAQKWVTQDVSPCMTGLWLNMPVLLEKEYVPDQYKELWFSREQNADAIILNEASLKFIRSLYEPDMNSPEYSPFNAESPHQGLPPVYLQVNGNDPVRDDGLIYGKVLRDHGVQTRIDVYPGIPHGYDDVFPQLDSSRRQRRDILKGFGWLLGKDVSEEDCAEADHKVTSM
ncbi:alpha/beta hydrolase fold-3 domain-containing protein [Trichoderma harzianum]|uniref:Alpha/beta hydrolase fold-3 domain-containing protein n=1 Tax=Trichoderma harzianum TaxID=5544 RepID=A0A0F9WW02_TRIHA|nr:alpha/beta hydrolase fold-3 domain-containing protein [Trichoderma harzianum]